MGYTRPTPLDPFVYAYDMSSGQISVASLTPAGKRFAAREPSLNGNGRFVALAAIDDVAAGDSNGRLDIYVVDRSPTPGDCANGANENGLASKQLGTFEESHLHDLSCDEIVGNGL
ncbi:MAG: hypothetical protein ABR507_05930 [Actinomycetota bacterium]|nr:hypothetical protein [Actinomycetota bacterium]